jgi:hypothetical protein
MLMGANKPHLLADQNEQIKRMLGMIATPEPEFKSVKRTSRIDTNTEMLSSVSSKKSFSYVSETSKKSGPIRANSTVRQSSFGQTNNSSAKKKGNDSDWEVEQLEDMIEKMELEETLEDYGKKMKK